MAEQPYAHEHQPAAARLQDAGALVLKLVFDLLLDLFERRSRGRMNAQDLENYGSLRQLRQFGGRFLFRAENGVHKRRGNANTRQRIIVAGKGDAYFAGFGWSGEGAKLCPLTASAI